MKGLPLGAVKNAMERDQQDPTILDLDHDLSLESQRPPEKPEDNSDPPLKEDPTFTKYFKVGGNSGVVVAIRDHYNTNCVLLVAAAVRC